MVLSSTLSDSQKIVLEDFYRGPFKKVAFNKLERKKPIRITFKYLN